MAIKNGNDLRHCVAAYLALEPRAEVAEYPAVVERTASQYEWLEKDPFDLGPIKSERYAREWLLTETAKCLGVW